MRALLSTAISALLLLATTQVRATLPRTPGVFATRKVAHVVGEIDRNTEFAFEMEMRQTADLPGDRLIIIDSPGGSVDYGLDMIKMMEREQAQGTKVTCLVVREASSMAFNLLTHCDVRLATADSYMVVHKVAFGGVPSFIRLTARELRNMAEVLDRTDAKYRIDNAKAMHLSLEEYDRYADRETAWAAKKLLRMGYLNGVIL